MYHFIEREKSKEMLLTSKPSLIYVMLIWSLFVVIYFGLQTILLQNMYQNPQSAAQVADGTSKHCRQLFSPGKEPKVRATLHCTWLVLCRKKMNVFSKSTLYVFSFTTLDQLDLQLQGFQYNLVESYLIWAFLKITSRICPMKLGKKIFCIALCLGEVTILNSGSERSFLLTNFVVKKWHFVQNRFLLFFPPYFLFVFLTLIKMIILPTATHKFRDSFEWTRKEKGT